MFSLMFAQTAESSHVFSLSAGFLAAVGVIGLVIKDLVLTLVRPKVSASVESANEKEWSRQESFRRDIYTFTQTMLQVHAINPKTGKVTAFCAMEGYGDQIVKLLEKQNGQLDRLSGALKEQSTEVSKLTTALSTRPCIVDTEVLDKLLALREAKTK